MSRSRVLRPLFASLLLLAAIAAPAQPARAPILALGAIEPGQWELRAPGARAAERSLCVADPAVLLQLRHPGAACSRFVIDNQPQSTTVHYTCPGAGHGRTTIRVETSQLVQIDSQGIADNAPFAMSYEGRRTGACTR